MEPTELNTGPCSKAVTPPRPPYQGARTCQVAIIRIGISLVLNVLGGGQRASRSAAFRPQQGHSELFHLSRLGLGRMSRIPWPRCRRCRRRLLVGATLWLPDERLPQRHREAWLTGGCDATTAFLT